MTKSRDPHLVNVVGALALALADAMRDATEAAAGMTGAAPAAVVALQQFLRGRTTEDLARATGLTHSGAVRLVDRLVEGGLVERRPGNDARSLAILLTASGRTLSHRITAARADAVASVLEGLRAEQRLDARSRGDEPAGWLCRLCDFVACGRPQGDCPAANAARSAAPGAT